MLLCALCVCERTKEAKTNNIHDCMEKYVWNGQIHHTPTMGDGDSPRGGGVGGEGANC